MPATTTPAGDDGRWLLDTLSRISLRYGRAVHALSLVPGPLALAYLYRDPDAADVQQAAEAITAAIDKAIAELIWIEYYTYPLSDPSARPGLHWAGQDDLTGNPPDPVFDHTNSDTDDEAPGGTHHQASPAGGTPKGAPPS
jgi:hypothetical protein